MEFSERTSVPMRFQVASTERSAVELGEDLFDGIEIGTVGRQEEEPGSGCADGCPYRKLNPDVLVVQSAQNWHWQHATEWLNSARNRRVPFQ
jgi:hypothetical protein